MRIRRPLRCMAGMLAVMAFVAVGCDTTPAAAPTALTPSPTAQTTQPSPTADTSPTAQPSPTSAAAQPTAVSTGAPTAAPAAALPTDAIWVHVGDRIIALGPGSPALNIHPDGQPVSSSLVAVASGGSHAAFVDIFAEPDEPSRLVVIDISSGTSRTFASVPVMCRASSAGSICEGAFGFSPDGARLAFTTHDEQGWKLQALDLQSGAVQTAAEGTAGDTLEPIGWASDALVVERVLQGTDAPAQGIARVSLSTEAVETLRQGDHLQAVPFDAGYPIALLTGSLPIGETPRQALSIFDPASKTETPIVTETQGVIDTIRWAPDGSKLLYVRAADYNTPAGSLHVVNVDGFGEESIALGQEGVPGTFMDAVWRDDSTIVLLMADDQGLRLYELPIATLDVSGLKELGSVEEAPPAGQPARIVYLPRE